MEKDLFILVSLKGVFPGGSGRNESRENNPMRSLPEDAGSTIPGMYLSNHWASYTCGCLFIQQILIQSLLCSRSFPGSSDTVMSKTNTIVLVEIRAWWGGGAFIK